MTVSQTSVFTPAYPPSSYEPVSYFSGSDRISAWYFAPTGQPPASRTPALVACSGFTGTKETGSHGLFIPGLVGAGYGVLLLDYRGWGESEGERGVIDPFQQVADARASLTYLETRDDVDPDRLGLFGLSFGGAIASYTAAVDERVKAAVSVSGVGDGPTWLRAQRRAYEWYAFLDDLARDRRERVLTGQGRLVDPTEGLMVATPERKAMKGSGSQMLTPLRCGDDLLQFRPVDVVHRIAPRAMLWFAVRDDPVVPVDQSERMYAAASEPKRLVVLPGREHYGAYSQHQGRIIGESVAWFDRYVGSSSEATG